MEMVYMRFSFVSFVIADRPGLPMNSDVTDPSCASFLADRTARQHDAVIGVMMPFICLSVTLRIVAKLYILQQKCLNK